MGKKKSNQQSQQLQRLAEVEDAITDSSSASNNRQSQKNVEEKVNNIHNIFPDWAKVDIRRALEESEYDEDRVINNHLTGADKWLEVKKKEPKEATISRPKNRRIPSGTQQTVTERGDRGAPRGGLGRGAGRGSKGSLRSDRKNNDIETAATVKEFIKEQPVDESSDGTNVRTFRSYSEAAAVMAQEPVVTETVSTERKERPKKERPQRQQQQSQHPTLQYIKPEHRSQTVIPPPSAVSQTNQNISPSSPQARTQQQYTTTTTITSPQKVHTSGALSPQERKESVILPNVDFNAVSVQFGSLGINEQHHGGEQTQPTGTRAENKESLPTAPTLGTQETQQEAQSEYYAQNSAWGANENQYSSEQYGGEEETGAPHDQALGQFQQQYPHQQQPNLYAFQQPQQPQQSQPQQQPRTGGEKGAQQAQPQRTSPNLPYGKGSYPTPYGTMPNIGAQNPYPYPSYPSYHHPYMMPNQFQYPNYGVPNAKFPQQPFYGKNPYYAVPTASHLQGATTAPSSEDSAPLDYSKQNAQQFDTNLGQPQPQHYFYMQHHQQQQQQPQQGGVTAQEGKGGNLKGKDSRSQSGEQPAVDPQHQQPHAFGPYQGYMPNPNVYNNYSYMFQPPYGHQQYPPQPTTQQGGQAHGTKSSRDQQQQSSLTSAWQ